MSVNITSAYLYPRTAPAANFTSANTPLGNATINAAEIGFESDTKRVKIGIGNWTTIGYLANETQLANKTDIGHTHAIANVTGLQTALDGKASTSHTHAASDITSGTIVAARLPIATCSTVGAVKPGTGLSVSGDGTLTATGGGGNGTDLGFFYDVRDYGAAVGSANAANNTAAFQAAADAAAVQSGGWGGGQIYVPACENQDAAMWDLRTPVWVHGANVGVIGEGSRSTFIRSRGPAFVLSKHPRFWDLWKSSYPDLDNANATVCTTATVNGTTQWVNVTNYKPDLFEFRAAGIYPPTNGNPAFAPSISAGQYFGIRSRRGVAQGRYPYCPMINGNQNQSGQSAENWTAHSKVTWEAIVYHHDNHLVGGIFGGGTISSPDPYLIYGAGDDYYFELAVTDADGIRRSSIRAKFPQTKTKGIHRITIQFDPDNSDTSKQLVAWVDRVRVAVTVETYAWYYGGQFHPLNSANTGANTTGFCTTWNRVARWMESDLHVCGEQISVGYFGSEQADYLTDYTVLVGAVHTELLYAVGSIGSAQLKIDGVTAADDSTVWAMTTGNNSRTKTLGWICNEFDWSPNNDTNLNVNLKVRAKSWADCWGYLCPKGDSNGWGGFDATPNNSFKGFTVRQQSGFQVSCGLLLGPFLGKMEIEDVSPAEFGFDTSIGSMWRQVSYYGRFRNLKINRQLHLIHMTSDLENIEFNYCNRCALRITGSEFRMRSFSYPALQGVDEGFLVATAGASLGAGIFLQDGTINSEGLHFQPKDHMVYLTKHYAHPNNKFVCRNVQWGDFAAPVIYLDDYAPTDPRETVIDLDSINAASAGPYVIVRGKDWHGSVTVSPDSYMTDMIQYENALSGANWCDVKTVDKTGYGIPPCGGFIHNAHEVHVVNPPEGGVSLWVARKDSAPTTVYREGSATPLDWTAAQFNESYKVQHPLSANILPGIYATCSLPWPNATNPTTIEFSGMTKAFSRSTLATILTGAAAPTRTHISLRWGFYAVFHTGTTSYPPGFFGTAAIANSGTWGSAASGVKATTANITVQGKDPDDDPGGSWDVRIRRKWAGAIMIGGSSVGDTNSPTVAFVFRTNLREPSHWVVTNANTPVIVAGNLTLARASRTAGNWTHYAANRILDWIVGGTHGLASTWHFGLSSTALNSTAGTGATEPSGGSYARVSVTMNSTNWAEHYDSGFYSNSQAIEFPTPTGDWGRCTHWFISDAASGGNIIACGQLNRPVRVFNGDGKPTFMPGAFQIQL